MGDDGDFTEPERGAWRDLLPCLRRAARRSLRALPVVLLAACGLVAACGGTTAAGFDAAGRDALPPGDAPAAADGPLADAPARADAPLPDAVAPDGGTPADASPGDAGAPADGGGDAAPLGRARQWVRDHPMVVAGLSVVMGAPAPAAVTDYYDAFHATAAHLWATGLPDEAAGWAAAGHPRHRLVTWLDPDGTSHWNGLLLGGLPAPPAGRVAYQLGDEPRTLADLQAMKPGFDAVRAADPDALVVMNFATDTDIEPMAALFLDDWGGDIVSYDAYTRSNHAYGHLGRLRGLALARGAPYWRYLTCYAEGGSSDPALAESDLRWDAFLGLLYGYTGHTWFIYQIGTNPDLIPVLFTAQGDYAAAKAALFATVAQINLELAHLGRAVTQLTSTDVRYVPTTVFSLPEGVARWTAGAGGDPYLAGLAPAPGNLALELAAGFFVDAAGSRYLMVQNVRHANGDWPVNSTAAGTARLTFDFATAPAGLDRAHVLVLDKATGAVTTVGLTPTGATTATLDLTLAAGDAALLKYADGVPFALAP
jgi:hypothetical protein